MRRFPKILFWCFLMASCTTISRLEAPEFVAPQGCPNQILDKTTRQPQSFPWLRRCEQQCSGTHKAANFVACCMNTLVTERTVCASYCNRGNSQCFSQCTDNLYCTVALAADCVGLPFQNTKIPPNGCSELVPPVPDIQRPEIKLECRTPPAAPQFRVKLNWKESLGASGYLIDVANGPLETAEYETLATNIQTNTFTDLVYYGIRHYRIKAQSSAGISVASKPITVITRESDKNHCVHPAPMESP